MTHTSLTNEQLTAMEGNAPLLVSEVRNLKAELNKTAGQRDNELIDENQALRELVRSLVYTMRSGVIAHSTVQAQSERARDLGCWP